MADVGLVPGVFQLPGGAGYENARTSGTFVQGVVFAAAATGAIWTPAAGKRFRLLGFSILATANAACATNDLKLDLRDSVAGNFIASFPFFAPTVGVTANPGTLIIAIPHSFGANGYLSSAINNVLTLNLSVALTAGTIRVNAWGTEE